MVAAAAAGGLWATHSAVELVDEPPTTTTTVPEPTQFVCEDVCDAHQQIEEAHEGLGNLVHHWSGARGSCNDHCENALQDALTKTYAACGKVGPDVHAMVTWDHGRTVQHACSSAVYWINNNAADPDEVRHAVYQLGILRDVFGNLCSACAPSGDADDVVAACRVCQSSGCTGDWCAANCDCGKEVGLNGQDEGTTLMADTPDWAAAHEAIETAEERAIWIENQVLDRSDSGELADKASQLTVALMPISQAVAMQDWMAMRAAVVKALTDAKHLEGAIREIVGVNDFGASLTAALKVVQTQLNCLFAMQQK